MFSSIIKKAYAQSTLTGTPISTNTLIQNILANIVNPLITLMVAVAVIYFLYGVFEFVKNAESSEERKKGGMHMLFGAIGLALMATAYGVLNLIIATIRTP
jgi:hypothetical protein